MKNLITRLMMVALLAVGMTGCDDYLDVNTPASAVSDDQLEMKDVMGPILHSTVYGHYYAATSFANYTQYFGGYGYGAAGKAQNSAAWNSIYLYVLPNLKKVRAKGEVLNAKHYLAIANIVEAINMGLAADSWDNVPYSQTGDLFTFPHPEFDTQEQVYDAILALLDGAIVDLEGMDESNVNPGSEDIIYGGDKGKWLRAAYTFKARFQLRLLNKGKATPADVLASINNGFTSNADDFQLDFPSDKINPWYQTDILSRNTGNYYYAPNDQLISMMNGTSYPFEGGVVQIDPRLPAIFENEGAAGDPWRGFMNGGEGESSDGENANVYYKDGGFHTRADAPLMVLTYAEAMFIKAEAALLAGSSTDAYNAYMDGIAANMNKIGVNGSAYMADPVVNVGADNLQMHHIMKEKYIANIHNTETFTDFRRYDFSSDIFRDLALRLEAEDAEGEMVGLWYQRAIYPTTEKNANEEVVLKNWQEPNVPVWWAN